MVAGVLALLEKKDTVNLCLPGGRTLCIAIASRTDEEAVVVKDAGDDPDVTDRIRIHVRFFTPAFTDNAENNPADPRDILLQSPHFKVILHADSGIGLVKSPGLSATPGKWAINPGPCRILLNNLELFYARNSSFSSGTLKSPAILGIGVSAENGEETALRTLNPKVGIIGGISILGNTGIVTPYSNAAYAETIRLELKTAALRGEKRVCFTTGARTDQAVQAMFQDNEPVIRIADFIGHALRCAVMLRYQEITVACMPGKLFKYACGYDNTHAHLREMDLARIRDFPIPLPDGFDPVICHTVGEFLQKIPPETLSASLTVFAEEAWKSLWRIMEKCGKNLQDTHLQILVFQEDGTNLLNADESGVHLKISGKTDRT